MRQPKKKNNNNKLEVLIKKKNSRRWKKLKEKIITYSLLVSIFKNITNNKEISYCVSQSYLKIYNYITLWLHKNCIYYLKKYQSTYN